MDLVRQGLNIARETRHTSWVSGLLFVFEIGLCNAAVLKIPYTEIDWKAYMQQVNQYIGGERDYIKIYGDTGPLVYPAAHVYIYRLLYYFTDEGRDIRLAQNIFIALYLAALLLVFQCYRKAGAPPYVFPMLVLSRRLHSIFLLRLFNDGFAVFFLFLAIFCYQRRWWTLGSVAFSTGLGVKMSLLLALPAIGVVLWQGMGRDRAMRQAMIMGQLQIVLGYPFLASHPRSYLHRAFELSRQFLFKWTVNWRFLGEEMFLSRQFSIALLALHALLLLAFISTKWLQPTGVAFLAALKGLIAPPPEIDQMKISRNVTPSFILRTTLSSMAIGCLCARSLHYQFFVYIAWSTPFLLWQSGLHPILIYGVWAAQEWAWNIYPSTNVSSAVVVGCLGVAVCASWFGNERNGDANVGKTLREKSD